jgi:TonB family protein
MNVSKIPLSWPVKLWLMAMVASLGSCTSVKPVQAPTPASSSLACKAQPKPSAYQAAAVLLVSVRADGVVANAKVVRSTGDNALDQCAVDAAKGWPFGPNMVDGLAPDELANVSMTIDASTIMEPGCTPSSDDRVSAHASLRVVGIGLRGDQTDDPRHEIYLTVLTEGCGSSTLSASWRYEGPYVKPQLVNQTRQNLITQGPATTLFNVKNPNLWPFGSYRVDIEVNDLIVATKHFVIDGNGLSVVD